MRYFKGKGTAAMMAAALAASCGNPCAAQVRLPGVNLPQVPLGAVTQSANTLGSEVGGDLAQVRSLRVHALIHANRREIDTDRNGAAVVRGTVLAMSPSDAALAQAAAAGFELAEDHAFAELDLRVVRLRAPAHLGTRAALERLRKIDPAGSYDYDHLFDAGGIVAGDGAGVSAQGSAPARDPESAARIGLIDAGVDAAHAVFQGADIHLWGCDGHPIPSDHGTAVASLLIGGTAAVAGVLPQGEMYAADVYCGRATGGAADGIIAALAWLVSQNVAVINISLVGPQNLLLARAVERAQARGHIIVAAVGNDGPAAPALYPAAYPGVIGVTAVDAHRKVLLEACRGPQVSFAAPGADMQGAGVNGSYHALRGTSFAAPIVAALLARRFPAADAAGMSLAVAALAREAIDLGAPGRDVIYGYGLVGAEYRVPPGAGVH
jgi:hypothetical protein